MNPEEQVETFIDEALEDIDVGESAPKVEADEHEKMNLLLAHFDEQQMSRYEAFRRAGINRNAVRKYANAILNQSITANVSVALSGMSKVLVGEIVEKARDYQAAECARTGAEPGPLTPAQLRAAWRLYKMQPGALPGPRRRLGDAGHLFK